MTSARPLGALPPLDAEGRLRRAVAAVSLCLCGAVPSFGLAMRSFDLAGLLLGVGGFAAMMIGISWSGWFRRRLRKPHVRRSLSIVYWGRVALSVAWPVLIIADGFPGLFALATVEAIGFVKPGSNASGEVSPLLHMDGTLGTFLIVLVQGTFLNAILLIAAILLWSIQRLGGPGAPPEPGTTFCRRCGYCRDGFPGDHPCAECGDTRPPLPWTPTWVDRWSFARLLGLAISAPAVLGGVAAGLLYFTGLP